MIYLLLSLFAFLYIFSASKVINTGDAGEFAVGAITLGIAHPSGYPLYMEVLKLFSFLPLGSIPFRMVLVSVVFSLLSLYMLYKLTYTLTKNPYVSLFPVAILGVSYSFFGQSVVIKFYTLNLFIISLLLYFGLKVLLEGYERKMQFLVSFLLGLSLANHHTAIMMTLPLLYASSFYMRQVLRNLPLSLVFFVMGFLVNLHMLIRGNRVFAPNPVYDLKSFVEIFLRKPYNEGSSPEVAKGVFTDLSGYYYAAKNLLIILDNNFPLYAFALFLLGVFWTFKFSKKLGVYMALFFITYSLILAKMTFSFPAVKAEGWYIGAHQYFLPALFGFALFCGLGFYLLLDLLKKTELLKVVVPVSVSVYALTGAFERLIDQNFNDNYIAYSISKSILSSLPVGSLYLTYGDNHTFGSWYFKYVARYRQDICSNDYLSPDSNILIPRGCYPQDLYKNSHVFSEFFKGNLADFANHLRLYSIVYIKPPNPLAQFFKNEFWVFSFALVPKNIQIPKDFWSKKLLKYQDLETLSMMDCAGYITDDRFSTTLCNYSLPMFAYMISLIEPKKASGNISYDVRYMGKTFRVSINAPPDKNHPGESFSIKVGTENQNLIELYNKVMENNKLEKFKYYPYTEEYINRGKR